MAHELSIVDGRTEAAFAVGGEEDLTPPWHGLGVYCDKRMSPMDAIEKAGLTWTVEKKELFYNITDVKGETWKCPIEEKVACIRSDNCLPLGVVGVGYEPLQHKEQAEFIEALVGEGAGTVECVGALFRGRKTFWTVKCPKNIIINKTDVIDKYLIISNAHDGTAAFRAFWSPIRVVCNNTLTAALSGVKNGVSIRHTTKVKERIEDARQILNISDQYYNRLGDVFQQMADTKIDAQIYGNFLDALYPLAKDAEDGRSKTIMENKRSELVQMMKDKKHAGAKEAGNTIWGLYNAITYKTSHLMVDRGLKDADIRTKLSTRMDSLMFGGSREKLGMNAFMAASALLKKVA